MQRRPGCWEAGLCPPPVPIPRQSRGVTLRHRQSWAEVQGLGSGLLAHSRAKCPAGSVQLGRAFLHRSGCFKFYTPLQVFINTLFRVAELLPAQHNKHAGNHGDMGISALGRNSLRQTGFNAFIQGLMQGDKSHQKPSVSGELYPSSLCRCLYPFHDL